MFSFSFQDNLELWSHLNIPLSFLVVQMVTYSVAYNLKTTMRLGVAVSPRAGV